MHIYKGYSHPSTCDYFDTSSELAISLLTEIHHHLTHSLLMITDFNFMDILLAVAISMATSE